MDQVHKLPEQRGIFVCLRKAGGRGTEGRDGRVWGFKIAREGDDLSRENCQESVADRVRAGLAVSGLCETAQFQYRVRS